MRRSGKTFEAIEHYIDGATYEKAAQLAGVSLSTLWRAVKANPQIKAEREHVAKLRRDDREAALRASRRSAARLAHRAGEDPDS